MALTGLLAFPEPAIRPSQELINLVVDPSIVRSTFNAKIYLSDGVQVRNFFTHAPRDQNLSYMNTDYRKGVNIRHFPHYKTLQDTEITLSASYLSGQLPFELLRSNVLRDLELFVEWLNQIEYIADHRKENYENLIVRLNNLLSHGVATQFNIQITLYQGIIDYIDSLLVTVDDLRNKAQTNITEVQALVQASLPDPNDFDEDDIRNELTHNIWSDVDNPLDMVDEVTIIVAGNPKFHILGLEGEILDIRGRAWTYQSLGLPKMMERIDLGAYADGELVVTKSELGTESPILAINTQREAALTNPTRRNALMYLKEIPHIIFMRRTIDPKFVSSQFFYQQGYWLNHWWTVMDEHALLHEKKEITGYIDQTGSPEIGQSPVNRSEIDHVSKPDVMLILDSRYMYTFVHVGPDLKERKTPEADKIMRGHSSMTVTTINRNYGPPGFNIAQSAHDLPANWSHEMSLIFWDTSHEKWDTVHQTGEPEPHHHVDSVSSQEMLVGEDLRRRVSVSNPIGARHNEAMNPFPIGNDFFDPDEYYNLGPPTDPEYQEFGDYFGAVLAKRIGSFLHAQNQMHMPHVYLDIDETFQSADRLGDIFYDEAPDPNDPDIPVFRRGYTVAITVPADRTFSFTQNSVIPHAQGETETDITRTLQFEFTLLIENTNQHWNAQSPVDPSEKLAWVVKCKMTHNYTFDYKERDTLGNLDLHTIYTIEQIVHTTLGTYSLYETEKYLEETETVVNTANPGSVGTVTHSNISNTPTPDATILANIMGGGHPVPTTGIAGPLGGTPDSVNEDSSTLVLQRTYANIAQFITTNGQFDSDTDWTDPFTWATISFLTSTPLAP